MKYFETLIEDQETTISVLYKEQIVKIYSSEPKTIQKLIKALGKPTVKYKKSKTYWSGASWDINFFDIDSLTQVLNRDVFIDKKVKPIEKKRKVKEDKKIEKKVVKKTKKTVKNNFEQIQMMF